MLRRFPPLKSLVYFEAAARLSSFTRASQELHVTQGAVSRQIRQLESFLGRTLFARENRQAVLTDDGHNYYVSISHILEQLGSVTEALLSPALPNQVTIATSSALASMYLLPRIPAFRKVFPKIQIRIIARENISDLGSAEYDLALYYERNVPNGKQAVALFGETVFPVCSPGYLEDNQWQFSGNLFRPNNLIWLESTEDWVNWPEWLMAMDIMLPNSAQRFMVSNYNMVIQAAMESQGVALAWSQLIERELSAGTLIKPCDHVLTTDARIYLMQSLTKNITTQTGIFSQWLVDQSKATAAAE